MKSHIGRFELKRLLGQGAQAQVWLAFDPRLEREVAIKQMKPVPRQEAPAVHQWLQEARSVSRLTHAHIVPLFEADVHEQQPYLVFEYVVGETLARRLAEQGAVPAAQAVAILQDVLSALVAAHAGGVVHRDLKPSNVLLDAQGRARVMDFGIAARTHRAQAGAPQPDAAGSPGYMAPEAVRGEAISPLMDVYGAGMLLAELLWGKPVRTGASALQALQRAAREPLQLPQGLLDGLDDALRAMLLRATAFDALQRYPHAQAFLDALRQWSGAHAGDAQGPSAAKQNSTLEFLLRRMRSKSDFPALSESIGKIQSMAASDKESVGSVTNEILKDVALTNKLLRLVNSAHYARGTSIGTVSRAVSLVGLTNIRNMALSLVLLEHMQDRSNAHLLKEEFLRALMAGSVAGELGRSAKEGEEAFIGALFQNLGRMLAQFYFAEEAAQVRKLVGAREPLDEETAATRVLGTSYEALGLGVAKAWGLPESIQRCIVRPPGAPPGRVPANLLERLSWSSRAANDIADAMLCADAGEVDTRLAQAANTYARSLGLSVDEILAATALARKKLVELAQAMDITVRASSLAAQLLKGADAAGAQALATSGAQDALVATELQATQKLPASLDAGPPGRRAGSRSRRRWRPASRTSPTPWSRTSN